MDAYDEGLRKRLGASRGHDARTAAGGNRYGSPRSRVLYVAPVRICWHRAVTLPVEQSEPRAVAIGHRARRLEHDLARPAGNLDSAAYIPDPKNLGSSIWLGDDEDSWLWSGHHHCRVHKCTGLTCGSSPTTTPSAGKFPIGKGDTARAAVAHPTPTNPQAAAAARGGGRARRGGGKGRARGRDRGRGSSRRGAPLPKKRARNATTPSSQDAGLEQTVKSKRR